MKAFCQYPFKDDTQAFSPQSWLNLWSDLHGEGKGSRNVGKLLKDVSLVEFGGLCKLYSIISLHVPVLSSEIEVLEK